MVKQTKTTADLRRAAWVVAAGVVGAAVIAATATPATAQYRRDSDGRALDANTRVGSGGQNDGGASSPYSNSVGRNGPMVTGNQIVTGNVTAGRQFRGPVGYSDPGSFRGVSTGSFASDRFVRDSAGVPRTFGPPDVDLSRPTAFYGSGRVEPPPVGYVPTAGATGGYVPTDTALAQPNLGLQRAYSATLDPVLRSSELIMPSPDASDRDSVLSASPLYGVRIWRAGESPNDFLAGDRTGNADRPDRFGADPNSISRMRDEVNRAGQWNPTQNGQPGQNNGPGNNAQGNDTNSGNSQGQGQGQGFGNPGLQHPLNQSIGGPADQQAGGVAQGGLQSALSPTALQSSVATGQSVRSNLLVSPDRQTPQLARLRQAFERQQRVGGPASDVEAARQFNMELQASRRQGPGAPTQGAQPGAGPGTGAGVGVGAGAGVGTGVPSAPRRTETLPGTPDQGPGAPVPDSASPPAQPQAPAAPAQPEKIGSIAEGVEAKGLHDVLASAEGLMRQQKFTEALQKYDLAQRVAPNNPLIAMGRANAELGASFYRRAETNLRDAVSRAPELAVAQFDLRALIGDDRLQVLVGDLKDLAAKDPKDARPPLLLAYIAYNTGNEAQAGEYLASAEQRAGADDSLLKTWRRYWKVPGAAATEPAPQPQAAPQP